LLKPLKISNGRIKISECLEVSAETMLAAVKEQWLESCRRTQDCGPITRSEGKPKTGK
jgi:hypothetical protein